MLLPGHQTSHTRTTDALHPTDMLTTLATLSAIAAN